MFSLQLHIFYIFLSQLSLIYCMLFNFMDFIIYSSIAQLCRVDNSDECYVHHMLVLSQN